MLLYHATTRTALATIQTEGLRVAKADPQAKLKGVWMASASNRAWGVLHTVRKHKAPLDEVVVLEVRVARKQLTRFKSGLWYSKIDILPAQLGQVIDGAVFGASASE